MAEPTVHSLELTVVERDGEKVFQLSGGGFYTKIDADELGENGEVKVFFHGRELVAYYIGDAKGTLCFVGIGRWIATLESQSGHFKIGDIVIISHSRKQRKSLLRCLS